MGRAAMLLYARGQEVGVSLGVSNPRTRMIDAFNKSLDELTTEIEKLMRPFAAIRDQLDQITGIGPEVATEFIGGIGVDMSGWPTPGHAPSWAGLCA